MLCRSILPEIRIRIYSDMARSESLQTRVLKYYYKLSDDPNDFLYKCLISDGCVKPLSGKKLANLVCHAKTHKDFFRENFEMNPAELRNMPAKRLHYIQSCAEFVTVNGEPFSALNKSGFVKLNAEKLQQLKNTNHAAGLGPKQLAVKEHIVYLRSQIIEQIKSEVSGKFLSLMVDTATKFRRSIMGISLQFLQGSSIIIRSIGMVHLTQSHTAAYLAEQLLDRLKLFDIKIAQIIAITADNARNMTAMINLMNDIFDEECNTDESSSDDEIDANENDHNIDNVQENDEYGILDVSGSSDVNTLINNALEELELDADNMPPSPIQQTIDLDDLVHNLEEIFTQKTLNINGIRCAAHTLQLAVMDALKAKNFQLLICLCRAVAKELRKQSIVHELRDRQINFKIPSIDCITRWNSIYKMVIMEIFFF